MIALPFAPRTCIRVMRMIVGLLTLGMLFSLALSGCPSLPKPDGCPPWAQRCNNGRPELCSGTQRWTPVDRPCDAVGAVCCRASSPAGREVYACVPASACLPEPDAGVQDAEDLVTNSANATAGANASAVRAGASAVRDGGSQ